MDIVCTIHQLSHGIAEINLRRQISACGQSKESPPSELRPPTLPTTLETQTERGSCPIMRMSGTMDRATWHVRRALAMRASGLVASDGCRGFMFSRS